ncbi:MAG: alpha/beta fold hydrolase [Deltaproteobacteria bacterium]|nr:alpha/beta fold hydrolase [Kofleriaceae bacterium]
MTPPEAGNVLRLIGEPTTFDLVLPSITLEGGAQVAHHVVRGWHWGPKEDEPVLRDRGIPPGDANQRLVTRSAGELAAMVRKAPRVSERLSPDIPTVVVVHALTGDARAGGPGGWWEPLIGPGRTFDPSKVRVLCFNLLGGCYGTSGPADGSFPRLSDDQFPAELAPTRGGFAIPAVDLPATVTTWDQARSILLALDALGVSRVALLTGGSLGGMVALCLAALDPERFERLVPIAACAAASSWILAWNHVGRQAILADPGFPHDVSRGLELARQVATITYRAEPGLDRTQGRRQGQSTEEPSDWSSRARYRVQTYLEHQGQKLRQRFDARSYLTLIGAMDHHDLSRRPPPPEGVESWPANVEPPPAAFNGPALDVDAPRPPPSWGLDRIRATTLAIGIDTDALYLPAHTDELVRALAARGVPARVATISSHHGHDAFLTEWDQLATHLGAALALAPARPELVGSTRWTRPSTTSSGV